MKRMLILLGLCCSLMLLFGCDQDTQVTNPSSDQSELGPLVQRPEFVDPRPPAQIATSLKNAPVNWGLDKKPAPEPPPDTTSGDPNPNPAHKYAYVVGISDYEGTANDLNYCDEDANGIKSYLQGEGFSVQIDLDQNATAANIEAGLVWLMNSAAPGDEIAFYYSGHGTNYPGYGSCLISTDMYYLTHGWVMQYINGANCTKKMIAMDACQLGTFHEDCTAGMYLATASDRRYSYDAPNLEHGAWTYYFLEATQTMIYAEDIVPYAEQGMKSWASIYKVRVDPKHTDMYTGMLDI